MLLYIPFYLTFIGRGISFLLIGSVLLVFPDFLSLSASIITIIVAFIYLTFSIWQYVACSHCDFIILLSLPSPFTQRDGKDIADSKSKNPINHHQSMKPMIDS